MAGRWRSRELFFRILRIFAMSAPPISVPHILLEYILFNNIAIVSFCNFSTEEYNPNCRDKLYKAH